MAQIMAKKNNFQVSFFLEKLFPKAIETKACPNKDAIIYFYKSTKMQL